MLCDSIGNYNAIDSMRLSRLIRHTMFAHSIKHCSGVSVQTDVADIFFSYGIENCEFGQLVAYRLHFLEVSIA